MKTSQHISPEQEKYNRHIEQIYIIDMKENNSNPKTIRKNLADKIVTFMKNGLNIKTEETLKINHIVWKMLKENAK